MSAPLSDATKAIITATVPALKAHGGAIVQTMYKHLLADPEIASLFNQSHQTGDSSQHAALANAILGYAQNINNLGVLGPVVERIVNKHVGLQIQPDHYIHVAHALLQAIADVLGDAATDEILEAWGEAYWFLANLLIDTEAKMYKEIADAPGGWSGWRAFRIAEIREESDTIKSFVLRPEDGQPVLRHKPGQYLSFAFDGPETGPARRNYSISCAPNDDHYRITVKREPGGVISGWLHDRAQMGDILKVSAPAGEFFLTPSQSEVVLLSAGVGLTPMVSMLESLKGSPRKTTFVHATLNGRTHAMGPLSKALASRAVVFYEAPEPGDHCDEKGRITPAWIAANTNLALSDYYICGPKGFMTMAITGLRDAGVSMDRIHFEFFGPAEDLGVA